MLKSSLFDYSDLCTLVKRTITITETGADAAATQANKNNKQVTVKICVSFTNCISKIMLKILML